MGSRDRLAFPLPAPDEEISKVRGHSHFAHVEPSAPEIVYELAEGTTRHPSVPAEDEPHVFAYPVEPRRHRPAVIALAAAAVCGAIGAVVVSLL